MKYIIFFSLLVSVSINAATQDNPEKVLVYNLSLDTTIKADYYNIGISVSEYVKYERINRKTTNAYIVSLDSLAEKLLSQLSSLGFNQKIEKSFITEADMANNYYRYPSDKKLFKVTYSIRVSSKDSIEYLFRNINREIISGMRISPELKENTIQSIREAMIVKGADSVKEYANDMASRLNQRVVKSKYHIAFYDGGLNNNYFDFDKKFQIDFRDIHYKVTINYTYYLSDKL